MTALYVPTTLLAIPVITTLFVNITRQRVPIVPLLSTSLLGFTSGWAPTQLDRKPQAPTSPKYIVKDPLQEQLRWRSHNMKTTGEPPPLADMPPPPLPPLREPSSTPTTTRSTKRFSVPISLPSSDNVKDVPASPIMISPASPTRAVSPAHAEPATPQANDFLTALAAQERRVLELKEELEKAETELSKLKKEWAIHEATKKRNELRHVEPLRPLKSPTRESTFPLQPITGGNSEEPKKKPISIRTRQSQRTVFEGGRHTRALSLLSPTSLASRGNIPVSISEHLEEKNSDMPRTAIPRMSTAPVTRSSHQMEGTKDDLVHTGKQFVGDIRDGLFNFFEDLRQATVGDEAMTAARSRQLESTLGNTPARSDGKGKTHHAPTRTTRALLDKSPTEVDPPANTLSKASPASSLPALNSPQWKANASGANIAPKKPSDSAATKPEPIKSNIADDDDEGWSNWDSPPPKSIASNTTMSTPRSSLR